MPTPPFPERIPALNRLGGRRHRQRRPHGRSSGFEADESSSEHDESYGELSVAAPPPPPARIPHINVVRERHSEVIDQRPGVNRGGRPPLPPMVDNHARPRGSVFNRISEEDSVHKVEERLKNSMKAHVAEMMKNMGHAGGSSAAALVKNSESPFTNDVQTCVVPDKFKLPSLESYDGTTDPVDHWQQFMNMMGLQNVPDGIICRAFVTTLKGAARMWCNGLSPSSVSTSQELGTKFVAHFLGTRKHSKPSTHLFTIRQGKEESLKDYASRFNQESLMINSLSDGVAVAAFMNGVSSPYCLMALARMTPKNMSDLLDEVNKQIGVEEALQGRDLSGLTSLMPSSKRQGEQNPSAGQEKGNKKNKKEAGNSESSGERAPRTFTPLTAPLGEVYAQLDPEELPRPRKMRAPEGKRDSSKYCRYHQDIGHDTNNCWTLQAEIEKLIRRGMLREFVDKKKDTPPKPKEKEHATEIFMIEGGSSFSGNRNRSRKAYIRRAQNTDPEVEFFNSRPSKMLKQEAIEVKFSDEDLKGLEYPHDDPLVITAMVGNHKVHRILVDTGATSNLMYYSAVKAMGFTGSQLTPSTATLVGFSGEKTRSLGTIKLPLTLGAAPEQVTIMAELLVLDKTPHYNAILGRGTLNEIKAVVATYSLTMRFPTPHGVGEVRGN